MNSLISSLQRLEAIGFRLCGTWSLLESGKPKLSLLEHASDNNVLYAFVCQEEVVYVGKTIKTLKSRMYGYANPGNTQFTNKRGNAEIRKALESGEFVHVYALPDNGLLRYGGFHLNLAAGLEDSLLFELKPSWNKRLGNDA